MHVRPHERFSEKVQLTFESVRDYASSVGDDNPLHHSFEAAAKSRFRRPIASGTQTGALLMALTAKHFSQGTSMVGLDFALFFKKAIYADEAIELEWLVIRVTPHAKLRGSIVELRGRVRNQRGETALGAKGRVLVAEKL